MNAINMLFRVDKRAEDKPSSNITKYPVGTRVPRNEKAELIVQNALNNRIQQPKFKRSM